MDEDTQLYYFGARYYDPRTSVWQSPDPILASYLPTAGMSLEKAENLPGQGGVFAPVNLNLYAYSHQRPVVMKDPNGLNAAWYTTWAGQQAHLLFGVQSQARLMASGRYNDVSVDSSLKNLFGIDSLIRPDITAFRTNGYDVEVWELKPITWMRRPEMREAAAAQLNGYISGINQSRGLFSRPQWASRGDNDRLVSSEGQVLGQISANGTNYNVRLYTGRGEGVEQDGIIYYSLTPTGRTGVGQAVDAVNGVLGDIGQALIDNPPPPILPLPLPGGPPIPIP